MSNSTWTVQTFELTRDGWRVIRETIPVQQRALARREWARVVETETPNMRFLLVEKKKGASNGSKQSDDETDDRNDAQRIRDRAAGIIDST